MMCHVDAMNIDGWTSFALSTKGFCLVFERDGQQGFLRNFDFNVYAAAGAADSRWIVGANGLGRQ